ncbi:DUF7507 domain-containing protein [Stenotrophomonas acidaminiphila]
MADPACNSATDSDTVLYGITLEKSWSGGKAGDTVALTIALDPAHVGAYPDVSNATPGSSTSPGTTTRATANAAGGTPVRLTETFSAGSVAGYVVTLACNGASVPVVIDAGSNSASATYSTPATGQADCRFTNTGLSQALDKALTGNADEDGSGTVSLGDTLTYTVTVTNTSASGDLVGVVVNDAKITPATQTCASVAPGATCVLTGTYVVTAADVAAGSIRNTAVATSPVCPAGSPDPACTTTVDTPTARRVIDAVDDAYPGINGAAGNSNVGNAYTGNDTLNGQPVDPSRITGTVTTPAAPINGGPVPALDAATGVVAVPAGTPAGSYTITYRICEKADPTNCDTATITVTVVAPQIDAVDDSWPAINGGTGGGTPSVLLNDTLNGQSVDATAVTLAPGASPNPGLAMNPDGTITVAPGTPAGTYVYPYQICDALNPSNCDSANATVVVSAAAIVANDDTYTGIDGAAGNPAVGNAYADDTLNGQAITDVSLVTGTVTAPATPINGGPVPALDTATGVVAVPAGTPAGSYTITYQICEVLNPANCDTATITVTVVAPQIDAVDDSWPPINGGTGGETPSVLLNDTLNGQSVDATAVTLAPGASPNPGLAMNPDGTITVAPGTPAGTYVYPYQICDALNPSNCDSANATVVVSAAPIVANDNAYTGIDSVAGNPAVGNAYADDTLNDQPIIDVSLVTGTVTAPATPINGGPVPALDTATGVVAVPAGTPAGNYTITYEICEKADPTNCDTATITVTVVAPQIDAVDDSWPAINGGTGGETPSVLLNDTLNGQPVDATAVTLAPGTSPNPGLVMNPDGTITVAPGTKAGTYVYPYQICDALNPSNCDSANATMVVSAAPIVANDNAYTGIDSVAGNPDVGNAYADDTLNDQPIIDVSLVTGTVTAPATPINGGPVPALDTATGVVAVPAGTPAGSYTIAYQICEVLNPANCDTATITVTVVAPQIDAVDDGWPPINGGTGGGTPSVLLNDTLGGRPVDAAAVTLAPGTSPNPGLAMNPDGTITVAPGTKAGTYVYPYQICDVLNPSNCDSANATVVVSAAPIVANDNAYAGIDSVAGNPDVGNAYADDTLNDQPIIDVSLVTGTVTAPATPINGGPVPVLDTATGRVRVPAGTPAGTYVIAYRICEVLNPTNCDPATITVEVKSDVELRVTKTAGVREVRIGDLVQYRLVVENVGTTDLVDGSIVDMPAEGFSYVEGSLVSGDADGMATVSGGRPLRFSGLDVPAGRKVTLAYVMRVGAGVRPGTHVNQAQAYSPQGESVSNLATAEVVLAADPLLDDSLVFGTVFNDRDGDGWQDSAELSGVSVRGGFAAQAYVAGSTTVDRGTGPQPQADAGASMLRGIDVGRISGRQSVADPVAAHQVVIRQRLRELAFTDDFVLTSAQGITVRMDRDGRSTVEKRGDAASGLNAAAPTVERVVGQDEGGYVVDYVIGNAGIDERGIPGVRIASVEGLLIETDQFGRYHLAGVDGGAWERGRNFILKVDPSTLPAGAVFTTDNPLLRRVTPGVPVRFDWGVTLPEQVIEGGSGKIELELGEVFFAPGSAEVRERFRPVIEAMAARVRQYHGGEVVIQANADEQGLAFDRANAVRQALLALLDPAAVQGLVVSVRATVDEPDSLVVGIDEGGALLGTVLFDTDRATIRPQFEPLLDRMAAALERMGGGSIAIVGHTDVRASHAYNTALGLRRARAVHDALTRRLGPELRARVKVDISSDPTAPAGARE